MSCKGLTEEQMKQGNGCGSSFWAAWIFRIPKWVSKDFYCACQCHDIRYQNNKLIINKWKADDHLLDDMY